MKCFCLSHHGAHKNLVRNSKTWFPAFDEVIQITPLDDWTPGTIASGTSCKRGVGEGFMVRVRHAIGMLSQEKVGALMDYDIVMPPIRIPDNIVQDDELLCSVVMHDDYHGRYTANVYGHSPMIATGSTWRKLLEQDGTFAGVDSEVSDRWLGLCAKRAGLTYKAMQHGFSRDGDWTNHTREMARQSGAVVFHGVKTDADFIAATHTRAFRQFTNN